MRVHDVRIARRGAGRGSCSRRSPRSSAAASSSTRSPKATRRRFWRRSSATSASSTTVVQPVPARGPEPGEEAARHQGAPAAVELGQRLHAEPDAGGPAEREPRHRGRLPARADDGERSRSSSRTRTSRSPTTRSTAAPFTDKKGKPLFKNVEGLDLRGERGAAASSAYLAAQMAKKTGGKQVIGAVGGLKIPPVDIWIAGYKFCAQKCSPGDQGPDRLLAGLRRQPTSARRSPRTRSPRARRWSSRSPAAAASAR